MGCGGREVTLEIFETYLKKLLHMIDKLPTVEKEKAVRIMKNSANHYYDLTLGEHQHLQVNSADFFNTAVSQEQLLEATPSPFSPLPTTESPSKQQSSCVVTVAASASSKLESEVILEEISDFAEGSQALTCLGGNEDTAGSESWDRHLEMNNPEKDLSASINPRCINCNSTFPCHRDFSSHYLPLSCIGCKKEFCNQQIYLGHSQACKGISHYRVKYANFASSVGQSEQQPEKPGQTQSQGKKHKCPECQLEFSTAFQLNKHVKGHNDNNCQKCEAKFAKRRFLVNHLKTVHYISTAEKYYNCKFCPRKFVKKPSLWSHYSEHTVGTQVVCLKCGEILEDSDLLKKHIEEHKTKARHTCEKCGDFFIRKQQYLAHLDGHEKHRCKICLKDFSSKKKLKHHRNFEHDPNNGTKKKAERPPDPVKNPNFTCVVCLQNYKTEALFNSHDCLKDGKKNEKLRNLSKDVSIKLSASKYKCRFCEFEHKKNSAVVRHARIHRNKKRFVCEQCGSAFNAHYTLKEHRIYVHSEDRKFSCTKCDKSFKARNALIRHEQVHSDKRPFACHCGQMFKRSSHLKRHLATSHKGEGEVGEVARPEQSWEEESGRYKTNWESPSKFGIQLASVALDVVSSLDLNMKQDKEIVRPAKYEKEKSEAEVVVGPEQQRARDGGQALYHEEFRGGYGHRYTTGYYPGPPGPPGVRQDKEYEQERLYQLPPPPASVSSSLAERNFPLEDRGYPGHSEAGPSAGPGLEPLFTDAGPADLTMTRANMAVSRAEPELGGQQYSRNQQAQSSRARYSSHSSQHYLNTSRPSYHHQPAYSLRLPDLARPNINQASLEGSLEDPYQGYSQRQPGPGQYFDQLDNYQLELSSQQSCEKKKKFYRPDGQEVLGGHPAHREDGLLPPLLALAPQHQPGQAGNKMDYLCNTQTDHLNSQYIQDSSLDYNITEY